MKYLEWVLISLSSAAAMGCAGKLNDDYYASAARAELPVTPAHDAGTPQPTPRESGSARASAGAKPDAGVQPAAKWKLDAASAAQDDAGPAVSVDSGSPAKPDAAAAACDFRGLTQMKCGNASCHGAPAISTGLDLTSPSLATRVAGRKAGGSCPDKLIVDKDNPKQSAIYLRVTGTVCGEEMPLGGSLTPNEQGCVLSWIEAL